MPASILKLPGDFQAGKTYWIKGETALAWRKAFIADRALPGTGLAETQTPQGRILSLENIGIAGGAAAGGGAFCNIYELEGQWMLTGGTVTGGEGNETIPDIDLGEIGAEPDDGTHFWLVCTGTAPTEDDVLLPGIDLTSASVASGASFPGTNTLPTVAAPSGTLHISLGSWSGGAFIPSGCGNIQLTHCPGTLSHMRL